MITMESNDHIYQGAITRNQNHKKYVHKKFDKKQKKNNKPLNEKINNSTNHSAESLRNVPSVKKEEDHPQAKENDPSPPRRSPYPSSPPPLQRIPAACTQQMEVDQRLMPSLDLDPEVPVCRPCWYLQQQPPSFVSKEKPSHTSFHPDHLHDNLIPTPSPSPSPGPLDLSTKDKRNFYDPVDLSTKVKRNLDETRNSEKERGKHVDLKKLAPGNYNLKSIKDPHKNLSDEELKTIQIKDLNKMVKENKLSKEEMRTLKEKRRCLKNRGYSQKKRLTDQEEEDRARSSIKEMEVLKAKKKSKTEEYSKAIEQALQHLAKRNIFVSQGPGEWYVNQR